MARDYDREYSSYHSQPEQIKRRAARVMARRHMERTGRAKKGDGKDVDHKDGNPLNNGEGNLRMRSRSANRADKSK
jgi:hypothetical protein